MTMPDAALERLVSSFAWKSNWDDVLTRAGQRTTGSSPRLARRRLILGIALLAAVVAPLTALSAANDWWLPFQAASVPKPVSNPVVVTTGSWSGYRWQLVAYPSKSEGLCFGVIPSTTPATSEGAALACGPFMGVSISPGSRHTRNLMAITYLSGSRSKKLPAYIAGPVIKRATSVEIRLSNGDTIHTATFAAPPPLSEIRFYATPLSAAVSAAYAQPGKFQSPVTWIAGLDAHGNVVACLAPSTAKNGISPMTACA